MAKHYLRPFMPSPDTLMVLEGSKIWLFLVQNLIIMKGFPLIQSCLRIKGDITHLIFIPPEKLIESDYSTFYLFQLVKYLAVGGCNSRSPTGGLVGGEGVGKNTALRSSHFLFQSLLCPPLHPLFLPITLLLKITTYFGLFICCI